MVFAWEVTLGNDALHILDSSQFPLGLAGLSLSPTYPPSLPQNQTRWLAFSSLYGSLMQLSVWDVCCYTENKQIHSIFVNIPVTVPITYIAKWRLWYLRHPGASSNGSQLLDEDHSHGWQTLATQPWASTQKRRQAPITLTKTVKREDRKKCKSTQQMHTFPATKHLSIQHHMASWCKRIIIIIIILNAADHNLAHWRPS